MGRARDIANVLSSSTNIALDSEVGLVPITPVSVTNTNGTVTIQPNGTVSFNAVSSLSLNNVFSSSYDNYQYNITVKSDTTDVGLYCRLRFQGSDNTTSNYYDTQIYGFTTTLGTNTSTSQNTFDRFANQYTSPIFITGVFGNPFNSSNWTSFQHFQTGYNNGTSDYFKIFGGTFKANTSFDSVTFYPGSGTSTGSVSIYGYKK